jgi:O-antigen/teichoic acid export membrane protein
VISQDNSLLRSRLIKGLGAQGYAQTAQIFIRLVEVPLLLGYWGTQLYGEWLMLAAIPAYLAMCDGGFAGAASREMSIRSGADDRTGALSLFQSTWLLLLIVSMGIALFAFLAIQAAPMDSWLGFKEMGSDTVKMVTFILVAHVLVGFQTGLVYGGFWCEGHYAAGMALGSTTQLLEFIGLVLAVVFGGGPVSAACGYLGGRIIGLVLMRLGLYRATPWLRYGWRAATIGEVKRLAAPAFASLAFPLGNAFNIQGMQLVIGLVLGPPAVVVFSALRTLSRIAMQPITVINRLMEPEMAMAYGGNRHEVFRALFSRSCQVAIWMSGVSCIILSIGAESGLSFWTHGRIAMDWPLFTLLLLSAAINAIWYTALMAVYATNRHAKVAIVYLGVYGIGSFCFAYVLVSVFKLSGGGIVLLFVEIIMASYVLRKTLQLTGDSLASLLSKISRPPWFLVVRPRQVNER